MCLSNCQHRVNLKYIEVRKICPVKQITKYKVVLILKGSSACLVDVFGLIKFLISKIIIIFRNNALKNFFIISFPGGTALENNKYRLNTVCSLTTEMPIVLRGTVGKIATFEVVLRILHINSIG